MGVLAAVGIGLSVAQGISGIVGANNAKKAAKKEYKRQVKQTEKIFNYNIEELTKTFINNTENNYSNIAIAMSELTSKYVTSKGESAFNSSTLGDASYSSAKTDLQTAIDNDYRDTMFGAEQLREYNETSLINNYVASQNNLILQKDATLNGLTDSYQSTVLQANQNALNSLIGAGSSIFGILENTGTSTTKSSATPGSVSNGSIPDFSAFQGLTLKYF